MATVTKKRVDALEVSHGVGGGGRDGRCPECGGLPDDDPDASDNYELVFVDPEDAGENEWCPSCGRQTAVVIEWGDEGLR
jgi:hypothetical protein